MDADSLKKVLLEMVDGIENVAGISNNLSRQISFLEELVKQDPDLKKKYEAAMKKKMGRGMGGVTVLKPWLRAKIQSL